MDETQAEFAGRELAAIVAVEEIPAPAASSTKSEASKLNEPGEGHNCDLVAKCRSHVWSVRSHGIDIQWTDRSKIETE